MPRKGQCGCGHMRYKDHVYLDASQERTLECKKCRCAQYIPASQYSGEWYEKYYAKIGTGCSAIIAVAPGTVIEVGKHLEFKRYEVTGWLPGEKWSWGRVKDLQPISEKENRVFVEL